jgi:hypothetical protein
MKSVSNLISYRHSFFRIFSQFLAIYFELFSSGSKFNSEIADMRGPSVSHRFPRRARLSARRSRALRALSGPRVGVLTATSRPRVSRPALRQRRHRPPHHARRRPPLSAPDLA